MAAVEVGLTRGHCWEEGGEVRADAGSILNGLFQRVGSAVSRCELIA